MKSHNFLIPEKEVLQLIKQLALQNYYRQKEGRKNHDKPKNKSH